MENGSDSNEQKAQRVQVYLERSDIEAVQGYGKSIGVKQFSPILRMIIREWKKLKGVQEENNPQHVDDK